ncbi:aminoacyl-histidine dipeptidase [Anaerosphaera multitolerans]|uniref:Cytosol non-specific dipeptidase n=1 Tax=Anaerosphaera multitolerans TaxID=2487351 RepID=A0A437S8D6_9FIRM|nr:aminoacyl-histidine dipeptidase [Anaerosphaera multitolerans]RVU55191.1 aminoacyl-histidine dipeptidase [Anaerosphaera multitolerans]
MNKLVDFEPKKVFHYFEEITKIPRCSLQEDKIADYLEKFAKDRSLECIRDPHNNIIIKKEASKGYENSPTLIIQGHMDMVCEKTENCQIDFENDSIPFEIENGLIISKETTLGADNGIAVAMALAILDDNTVLHPNLEILITSNEENGMTGARNLDGSLLKGEILLNLDSEREGVACIACAGGQREVLSFTKTFKEVKEDLEFYEVSISGLKGGHSGQEIQKGLGNSLKLLARSLYNLNSQFKIELVDIEGGAKPNAIPRYAKAIIGISKDDILQIQNLIVKLNRDFVKEFGKVDPDVRLNFEKSENFNRVLESNLKDDIINLLNVLPNGVQSMSNDIEGLVGSSTNVGVIESYDDRIDILVNIRSALSSLKESIGDINKLCSEAFNAKYTILSSYPAWEYREESYIRDLASKVYKELFNKELELEAIHAGLECGLFKETIGDIDMLSIGPNIRGPHAPGENLEIKSTERVYTFVLEILKNLK